MARRHKLWAAATRKRMEIILGGHCQSCGSLENLTFDCIEPCGHDHHARSAPERICFYRRQMSAGNVQLLCASCNAIKGDLRQWQWLEAVSMLHSHELSLRLPETPGRDTTLTAKDRVQWLREWLSELGQHRVRTSDHVDEPF